MNNLEFKHWRERLGLTQKEAAQSLGISTTSVELYERGSRRDTNDPVEIPPHVEYACVGLSLIRSAQNGNVMKATSQVRTLARDLMYFMSLGTSIATNRQSKFYDSWHEGLRETGEIPKTEMSLLEMLFPHAKAGELRKAIWALGNRDAVGPANEEEPA